jgi:hypothetical protein
MSPYCQIPMRPAPWCGVSGTSRCSVPSSSCERKYVYVAVPEKTPRRSVASSSAPMFGRGLGQVRHHVTHRHVDLHRVANARSEERGRIGDRPVSPAEVE